MKTLSIRGRAGTCTLMVGACLDEVKRYLPPGEVIILTDPNVLLHHGSRFIPGESIVMGAGEKAKTLDTVRSIYEKLVERGADRSCFILGIGGGVVCDVAGFVASTYLRGVRFGLVATTLLAQADAGAGGKNGVNVGGYKNMVGVIRQPEFVICDPELLRTLPKRELLSGFAEIVKHALIGDSNLFSFLEEHWEEALGLEGGVLERIVFDSLLVKASVVNRDETERGERRILNFGHTFGHAIESTAGVSHGEAVSAGMVIASRCSREKGYLTSQDLERILGLLGHMGLPTGLGLEGKRVMEAVLKDKKRTGERVGLVLLKGIGKAIIQETGIRDLEVIAGRWL
ncbi:MAG: 3-dehydroquinate synthase [Thermodesulfobacteriota bacterium]